MIFSLCYVGYGGIGSFVQNVLCRLAGQKTNEERHAQRVRHMNVL